MTLVAIKMVENIWQSTIGDLQNPVRLEKFHQVLPRP
jgi:hypothetical protein